MKPSFARPLALAPALLILAAFLGSPAAQAPSKSAPRPGARATRADPKEALARRLMELSGAGQLGKQVVDGMLDQFKRMPGLPEGFTEKFKELARPDEIVDLVVPIYARNYDAPTLQAVIDFYESDGGRAFVQKQPTVLAESQQVGQQWGLELSQRVVAELRSGRPAPH